MIFLDETANSSRAASSSNWSRRQRNTEKA
ncbi:hypothetical protein QF040_005616 [Variovorax sp. W2I14]